MKNKNIRSLYWTLILYDESDNLNFKEKIEKIKCYEYLYIKHNKDIIPATGEVKKTHYHVVIKFKNYKWLNSLSQELEIPSNYFEPVRNLNNILCYLIHFKEENKYHYDICEVKGSPVFKDKLVKIINNFDSTEEEKISLIFNFISLQNKKINFSDLVDFVLKKGLWAEFRRSALIFSKLVDEHNSYCYNRSERKGNKK